MPKTRTPVAIDQIVNPHPHGTPPILISGGYLGDNIGMIMRDFQTINGHPCIKVTQKGFAILMRGSRSLKHNAGISALTNARAEKSKQVILAIMEGSTRLKRQTSD